ncbi:MAG: hypothetical protein NT136_01170 [Candidatus Moranbacteria bacterium]|nr:hypothetical protein [Candidatus Moranbacteria bacterium]
MKPGVLERKIRKIVEYSRDKQPMLRIIKNNGESKFGEYIQLGIIEGGGRALFTRDSGISVYPLREISGVEYISKSIACYALNRSLIFN